MPPYARTATLIFGNLAALTMAGPALAHASAGVIDGFVSGFTHPLYGTDHLLAMLAVGIWGAQMGGRPVWMLPAVFPVIMACGGMLGILNIAMPPIEPAVALSSLVLGLAILAAWRAPEWIAIILVGTFAIFHGYAHGRELPQAVDPTTYGMGFVTATGVIHIAGIAFGLLFARPLHGWIARAAGGAIALAGVYFLFR